MARGLQGATWPEMHPPPGSACRTSARSNHRLPQNPHGSRPEPNCNSASQHGQLLRCDPINLSVHQPKPNRCNSVARSLRSQDSITPPVVALNRWSPTCTRGEALIDAVKLYRKCSLESGHLSEHSLGNLKNSFEIDARPALDDNAIHAASSKEVYGL